MNTKEYLQENKKISIIVPVYNTEKKQICECIDSLIHQTFSNIEIILIDDGSEQYIEEECKKYLEKDSRINYYKKENGGVSSARNLGITKATGDYLMFIDSDDWLDKKCCEEVINVTYKKNYDIIAFSYIKEYKNHREYVKIFDEDIEENTKIEKIYSMPILGTSCMKLYKKNLFIDEYFDETLENGEDVEFNFRIFDKVNSFYYLNQYFYYYRIQNKSAVRNFNENMLENYEKTIEKMKADLENNQNKCKEYAYYSFLGISYLMICLNYVYSKKNNEKERRKILKELSKKSYFEQLFLNYKKIKLPITRKLPIFCAKFKMYILLSFIIKVKKILDNR